MSSSIPHLNLIVAAAVILLALFLVRESRAAQPITPLRLFADRGRSGSYVTRLLLVAGMFGMFFFLTQFVQDILHFSPLQAGISFLPMTAALFAVSRLSPRLVSRFDPKILMALWLYATIDGVGSARQLDELCHHHAAYQWILGDVSINYHTLSDFRTAHGALLDQLLTQGVAVLVAEGLVERISSEIDRQVDARLAQRGVRSSSAAWANVAMGLGSVGLGIGATAVTLRALSTSVVPRASIDLGSFRASLMANTSSISTAQVVLIVLIWAVIAVVNIAYARRNP